MPVTIAILPDPPGDAWPKQEAVDPGQFKKLDVVATVRPTTSWADLLRSPDVATGLAHAHPHTAGRVPVVDASGGRSASDSRREVQGRSGTRWPPIRSPPAYPKAKAADFQNQLDHTQQVNTHGSRT